MDIQIIILSLLLSAFFSGIEIAFISADRLLIELKNKQGSFSGKILADFIKAPSRFIGATLIGNNIALVIFGLKMAEILKPWLASLLPGAITSTFSIMTFQTLICTLVILVFGEFFPKITFMLSPNRLLNIFAIPLFVIYYLLYPVMLFIMNISDFILRKILKTNFQEKELTFSKADLAYFIKDASPGEEESDDLNKQLFNKALHLTKVKIRECMVPRLEIEAVELNTSIDELKSRFVESGFSKIIIYRESIDNIIGFVHHFDLFKMSQSIKSILLPIALVPETMSAKELLDLFTNQRRSVAWVVDEFGGTAGIVTIEDLLEELFGEIEDEHDSEDKVEQQISDSEYIFSARHEIDYLNEKYDLQLPTGEYETLAGFIVAEQETIPRVNEQIVFDKYQFTIVRVSETKIETIRLKIIDQQSTDNSA